MIFVREDCVDCMGLGISLYPGTSTIHSAKKVVQATKQVEHLTEWLGQTIKQVVQATERLRQTTEWLGQTI